MLLFPVAAVLANLAIASQAQTGIPLEVELVNGAAIKLTLEELDAMDQVEFTTSTIWTDDQNTFSGVPVLAILRHVGAEGTILKMSALNDYAVEMPVSDLEEDAPILASRIDEKTMTVREKGPYWIMFPFDSDPKYQTESNFARSVWQLRQLKLLD